MVKTITYDTKKKEFGEKLWIDKVEKAAWLRERIKLPGACGFDSRIQIAWEQAARFDKEGRYTHAAPGTYDYKNYYDKQKELSMYGLLIDDEFYVTGDHYFYLNFLKINDKVKAGLFFPRFKDLDYWTFQCIELADLEGKYMSCLKARQTGFTLKFLARMTKRMWLEKAYVGKMATYEEKFVNIAWEDVLLPYRNHLNEHTGWTRNFHPSDKTLNWKEGTIVRNNGKDTYLGNLSSLRGITTKQKASAVVSGTTSEILLDEAGVSLNLGKVITLIMPALKLGNIQTGNLWVVGAAGEVKESEALQRVHYNPAAYNCLEFEDVWSKSPAGPTGMFVPYYYSYGDCIDEWGNSDIERAHVEFEKDLRKEEKKGYAEYALFKAQYPRYPEDAFANQEENIFPVEKIQPHYDRLLNRYKPTLITLFDDRLATTGVSHRLGSETVPVMDWPVTKSTDRRGAICVDEMPPDNPPWGLFYLTVDPIRNIRTDTSESLQSVYVYKAAHRIEGEYTEDKLVAWYCGRHDEAAKTYEITKKMMKRWNARTAIESDQASCIEWMIKEKMSKYLMKRSDIPILKDWVPTSQIHQEYGWRTGSGNSTVKEHLMSLIIEYCNEVVGTEFDEYGNAHDVYGVTRIRDVMLLKEMLNYNPRRGNYDRLIAFGAALMVARANTNRGLLVINKQPQEYKPPTPSAPVNRGLTRSTTMSSPFGSRMKSPFKR